MSEYKLPSLLAVIGVVGGLTLTALDPVIGGDPFNYGFLTWLIGLTIVGPLGYVGGREAIARWKPKQ